MKNHLACPGARKGATVAVAALVTLTIGLGARALADGIEVVSVDGAVAAGEGIAVVDGAQGEGEPQADGGESKSGGSGNAWQDLQDSINEHLKESEKKRGDGSEDSDTDDEYPFPEFQWPWERPLMPGDPGFTCFEKIRYLNEEGQGTACLIGWQDISDESFEDYGGFELGNGFYVVRRDRTFSERPNVVGDAKIILCDGATVNFKKGIRCKSGKLTIYAQSAGENMGKLIAKGVDRGAGIGGGNNESNGSEIVICGGHVEATGEDYAAGIGGGDHGGCGTVRILGGDVTAQGGAVPWYLFDFGGAAGIGSGNKAEAGGTVEISGGTVNANGGVYGAGIGSGDEAKTVAVTISGGTVNATGGGEAAGIGGGNEGGCDVTITGGNVTAKIPENEDTDDGAGIGTGDAGGSGRVVISGGVVDADGDDFGAGIGSGENSRAITVEISGGTVKARGRHGAGIGGGNKTSGGTITISGGTVEATSDYGAGVGGGNGRDSGTITITGGHVEAQNMEKGVAIGHGQYGRNRDIHLADHMMVCGENDNKAKKDERVSVLNKWNHAWVEPCDHAGAGEGHDCEWCVDPSCDTEAWLKANSGK